MIIEKEEGELVDYNNPSPETIKKDRKLTSIDDSESVAFYVNSTIYQKETNSRLKQQKCFEDINSAKKYLSKFIKVNPISDVILYQLTKKEIAIYEEE